MIETKRADSPPAATTALSQDDVGAITELREAYGKVRLELARVIIGQDNVVEQLLICILARGHGLLMGVPGLAKTTMRSEERRVGKECRSRWSPHNQNTRQ